MGEWVLIVVLGGLAGDIKGVQHVSMTQPQCVAAVEQFKPLRRAVAVTCVGPDGRAYNFDGWHEASE